MVADLQFQNKKLTEENSKLRTQLESTEEISENLSQELDELRRTIKRYTTVASAVLGNSDGHKSLQNDLNQIKSICKIAKSNQITYFFSFDKSNQIKSQDF